jgi:hypothetical protein
MLSQCPPNPAVIESPIIASPGLCNISPPLKYFWWSLEAAPWIKTGKPGTTVKFGSCIPHALYAPGSKVSRQERPDEKYIYGGDALITPWAPETFFYFFFFFWIKMLFINRIWDLGCWLIVTPPFSYSALSVILYLLMGNQYIAIAEWVRLAQLLWQHLTNSIAEASKSHDRDFTGIYATRGGNIPMLTPASFC